MSARRDIPPAVREAQAKASDPATSVFVAANAGAGKIPGLVPPAGCSLFIFPYTPGHKSINGQQGNGACHLGYKYNY